MILRTRINMREIPIVVDFDYRKGEMQTSDSPEIWEFVEINSIKPLEPAGLLKITLPRIEESNLEEEILENKEKWEEGL